MTPMLNAIISAPNTGRFRDLYVPTESAHAVKYGFVSLAVLLSSAGFVVFLDVLTLRQEILRMRTDAFKIIVKFIRCVLKTSEDSRNKR